MTTRANPPILATKDSVLRVLGCALVASWLAGCATDRLDAAPPSGVNLSGHWQLNANLSDDPDKLGPDPDQSPQHTPGSHRRHDGGGRGGGAGGGGMPPMGSGPEGGPGNYQFSPTGDTAGPGASMGIGGPVADVRATTGLGPATTTGLGPAANPGSGADAAVGVHGATSATSAASATSATSATSTTSAASAATADSISPATTVSAGDFGAQTGARFQRVALTTSGGDESTPQEGTASGSGPGGPGGPGGRDAATPSRQPSRGASINRLLRAPPTLSITQDGGNLTVKSNQPDGAQSVDVYTAGTKTTIPFGNELTAERTAGWRGPVFVVTTAAKKFGEREDDFAIDTDDGRLIMTTQTKGGKLGKVAITRVYDRMRE